MLIGNLFVMLDIVFPETISPTIQTILKAHLPKPPPPVESDDCEDHTLVTLDPVESFRATDIPDENAGDDDDDERMGGGGGAECRQQ
jgi:DnaJ family protein A protein 2